MDSLQRRRLRRTKAAALLGLLAFAMQVFLPLLDHAQAFHQRGGDVHQSLQEQAGIPAVHVGHVAAHPQFAQPHKPGDHCSPLLECPACVLTKVAKALILPAEMPVDPPRDGHVAPVPASADAALGALFRIHAPPRAPPLSL
jgi:hypothetical protein